MSRRGWLLFIALGVIWGIPYLLIKVAVRELTPASLVFLRTALGAALLLPAVLRTVEVRPLLARWRPIALFTVVEMGIPWLLLSHRGRPPSGRWPWDRAARWRERRCRWYRRGGVWEV